MNAWFTVSKDAVDLSAVIAMPDFDMPIWPFYVGPAAVVAVLCFLWTRK